MTKQDIINFWKIFEERKGFRLFTPIKTQNVSLGYDKLGKRSMFIDVPIDVKVIEPTYSLENLSFRVENKERAQLIISLKDESFLYVFNEFLYSIFSEIDDLSGVTEVVSKVVELYHIWSLFFSKESSKKLNHKIVLGLAGELHYMHLFLDQHLDADYVIDSWQGPFNRTHDFIFSNMDIEVKSKLLSSNIVHISGLFQLEFDKPLELGIVSFTKSEECKEASRPTNVVEMIELIINRLKKVGISPISFLNKLLLLNINYFDTEQIEELATIEFVIIGHENYDVCGPGFPRLVPDDIPDGLRNVKYDIDIASIEAFKI